MIGWFWISGLAVGGMGLLIAGLMALDSSGVLILPRDETGVLVIAALLFPATVLIGRTIWIFQLTRWRLWAYPRVDDLVDLKRRARRIGLIPRDGSWLERLEPRTTSQRDELRRYDPGIR